MKGNGKVNWDRLMPESGVVVILGYIRMGKSSLAHWLMERFHTKRGMGGAVLHLPRSRHHLLPDWVKRCSDIEKLPEKAVCIIDEGSQAAHARRATSTANLELDNLAGLAGQRDQLVFFITHFSRKLDVNMLTMSALVVWKQPSLGLIEFERPKLRPFVQEAYDFFHKVRGNPRRWSFVVDFHNAQRYQLKNGLASYWCPELSKAFADSVAPPEPKKGGKGSRKRERRTLRKVLQKGRRQ